MSTTLTASEAQPGDVVFAPDGTVCQYNGDEQWSQMTPVGSYGTLWFPEGRLTLLARDGAPANE